MLGSVFLTTFVLLVLVLWWMDQKKRNVVKLACEGSEKKHIVPWNIILFHQVHMTYKELMDCLDEENVIGSGGGGEVYKATLQSGQEVAIKKLWQVGEGMDLHDHGFKAEVNEKRNKYIFFYNI